MPTANSWILTHTGRHFSLSDPDPALVSIIDIAHALARINRFTGHGQITYSVAEHSVHVQRRVRDLGGSSLDQLLALLHDAPEAYVGDASSPLKAAMRFHGLLSDYDRVESRVWAAVAAAWYLPTTLPKIVRRADHELVSIEGEAVFGSLPPEWGPVLPMSLRERLLYRPLGWEPARAEMRFLAAWGPLWAEHMARLGAARWGAVA